MNAFDKLDKELLRAVADLEGIPKGAFNIRKNGALLARECNANIEIENNAKGTGIIIRIKANTRNESVHIPVILSQAGLYDVVENDFIIGENCDVAIIAGCGIHCGSDQQEGHAGIHSFHLARNARVRYVEKHIAIGDGSGKRALNPTTKVQLDSGAHLEMELTQLGGVDEALRVNEVVVDEGASLQIIEKVMTAKRQTATSQTSILLRGKGARSNMISRSVIRDDSRQVLYAVMEAMAPCFGHIECDAIIMDRGTNETVPSLKALHPDAELTHEASIGKIADEQLMKLMSLGLSYDEAVNRIIQSFLK
ncbi:MAG: SufD family Fe-S cluster assembly protein [Deltaproteobacteria bacterium]|nr:SufD family Fe-S cluster assembly protein [Deltaproteobacteria bacterium]